MPFGQAGSGMQLDHVPEVENMIALTVTKAPVMYAAFAGILCRG